MEFVERLYKRLGVPIVLAAALGAMQQVSRAQEGAPKLHSEASLEVREALPPFAVLDEAAQKSLLGTDIPEPMRTLRIEWLTGPERLKSDPEARSLALQLQKDTALLGMATTPHVIIVTPVKPSDPSVVVGDLPDYAWSGINDEAGMLIAFRDDVYGWSTSALSFKEAVAFNKHELWHLSLRAREAADPARYKPPVTLDQMRAEEFDADAFAARTGSGAEMISGMGKLREIERKLYEEHLRELHSLSSAQYRKAWRAAGGKPDESYDEAARYSIGLSDHPPDWERAARLMPEIDRYNSAQAGTEAPRNGTNTVVVPVRGPKPP